MILLVLVVLGLCFGSFTNALVWRFHEQAAETAKKKPNKKYLAKLSLSKGRSMCPHCRHELSTLDLVPFFSWLALRGKCRYCRKPISPQYPLVELAMAGVFVASYLWWPNPLHGAQIAVFLLWLVMLVGLMALLVYDLRWFLLPTRLIYPLSVVALAMAIVSVASGPQPFKAVLNEVLAVAVGGGIFYVLFQVSKGKWIGGGDVRLGWLLGLVAGTPGRSVLFIFLAALFGTAASLPLLMTHRAARTTTIPFGPFLILGIVVVQLFGHDITHWYVHSVLMMD